jgi:D-3-phosphoglycerate dehydrogenase
MKALILAPYDTTELHKLESRMEVIQRSWIDTQVLLEPEQFLDYINKQGVEIIVIEADFIFEDVFEGTDKLRFIGVCRGTVNNVDLDSATSHGVLVVNTPGRNSVAVAELTIGLMLALSRRIMEADKLVRSGNWTDPVGPYTSLRGSELSGKTAGIIGLGAIGREVAKRLQAFGLQVLAYDPFVDASLAEQAGVSLVGLEVLLKTSDIVTLHCTASEETQDLLGADQLALLKPTAYLINTASWESIEEKALLKILTERRIAGAAFDVFSSHPVSQQSPLLKLDNVILTPHIGGATGNTITRYSQMITGDILRFLDGRKPLNLINPEAWRGNGG